MKITYVIIFVYILFYSNISCAYTITGFSSYENGIYSDCSAEKDGIFIDSFRYSDGEGYFFPPTLGVSPEEGESAKFDALVLVNFHMHYHSHLDLVNAKRWGALQEIDDFSKDINLVEKIVLHYDNGPVDNEGDVIFSSQNFTLTRKNIDDSGGYLVGYLWPDEAQAYLPPDELLLVPINPAKKSSFAASRGINYKTTATLLSVTSYTPEGVVVMSTVPVPSSIFLLFFTLIIFIFFQKMMIKNN